MKKLMMFFVLMLMSISAFAVNDSTTRPCQGIHDLDNLFVEVYWKEGTTWYKVPDSQMDSIYPWRCMVENNCGGFVPWGDSYTCYIDGHANDKVTVSASSVPCRTENSNARSCWVWKDVNWGVQYNIYRIDIEEHYNWSEPYWGYYDFDYSLWVYEWADKLWTVVTSGYPFPVTSYTSESRTDIRNGDDTWVTTDSNWTVTLKHKKIDKRDGWYLIDHWVYLWQSTAGTNNFRKFQISLTKGTGGAQSVAMNNSESFESESIEESNTENDFIRDIDMRLAQKVSVYSFEGVFEKIFKSSSDKNEDDYSTSLRLDKFSDGSIAGFTIEKIDEKLVDEYNVVLNGMTIIAINGYKLEEFGKVEKMLEYLETSEIRELIILDEKMNLYKLIAE